MLRRLGGQDLVSKMVALFLERAPALLTAARQARAADDPSALAQAIHAFKSSAGQLGARGLFDRAVLIEKLAESGQGAQAEVPLGEIEAAYPAVQAALQRAASGDPS